MVELYRKHFHSDDLKPTPFLCLLEAHIFPNSDMSCKKIKVYFRGTRMNGCTTKFCWYNFDHLIIIPFASATAI